MQNENSEAADIAIVGAGHAGIEAALAGARMGLSVILFTMNLDAIGNMPCNPSIGGTGKGHLVFEIDALGGQMARSADLVTLQNRMLNLGKGPAVHSKRIQADRKKYHILMKKILEKTENLRIVQAEITDFEVDENNNISAVKTKLDEVFPVKAAVFCCGTYLNGTVIVGKTAYSSGPDGLMPATSLSASLQNKNIRLMRFKTGTPARVQKRSIDFTALDVQKGDCDIPFSSLTSDAELAARPKYDCHIVYTNQSTHQIIKDNLHLSPIYSGMIHGTGPRYCPSIEDKIVRFADKERHQLFIEPMGEDTDEMYIQGFSSSLPIWVQKKMMHSLKGFENAEIMRPAYAIEYDCIDPTQLYPTLEFKEIHGLYGAGQFNGTSGYEEAAAQGLVAGINAALKIKGQEPMILQRASSYIGTLIDDLVTKGTNEPYRIMTSRSEYRLLLRQDNADERLSPIGRRVGLLSEERYNAFLEKMRLTDEEIKRTERTTIAPSKELNEMLTANGTAEIQSGMKLCELIRRPQITYEALKPFDLSRPELPKNVIAEAEIKIKYEGYIKKQFLQVAKQKKLEDKKLPSDIDYTKIKGIRLEAAQKLTKIRPENIGQASRISGISPADISVLLIYLK